MRAFLIAGLALASAGSAQAQSAVLWQNLTVGMIEADVTALHPTGLIALTPDCEARIRGKYGRGGGLEEVTLIFGKEQYAFRPGEHRHDMACRDVIVTSMAARYGGADGSRERATSNDIAGAVAALNATTDHEWLNGDVKITLTTERLNPRVVINYSHNPAPARPAPSAAPNL